MRTIEYKIGAADSGKKIDSFLRAKHGYSSRALVKLKQYPEGILRNGTHARAIDCLLEGDLLTIGFCDPEASGGVAHVLRSNKQVEIAYEDEDLLIYNKPPFMPVHPSCGHAHDTLCNVFATHCDRLEIDISFRAINRLDRDTSGGVLVAKNRYAASALAQSCKKIYVALVEGVPNPLEGVIDLPIYQPMENEPLRTVHPDGQPSVTLYKVLETQGGYSLVEFSLPTGRTHQIRVHMQAIAHPLVGDTMYGTPSPLINRQALHCLRLDFMQPVTKQSLSCICSMHLDLKNPLALLGFCSFA